MKCTQLLLSRTLTDDYRWIITPQGADDGDLMRLRALYGHYSDVMTMAHVLHSPVPPLFCLSLSKMIALVMMKRTAFVDKFDRDIFCLQGLSVLHEDARTFSYLLPFLMEQHATYLDVWRSLNFDAADRLGRHPLEPIEIDVHLGERFYSDYTNVTRPTRFDQLEGRTKEFSFSQEGLHQLVRFLASPYVPFVEIGFGVTSRMLRDFASISVVSRIPAGPGDSSNVRQIYGTNSAHPQPHSNQYLRPSGVTSSKKEHSECEIVRKESGTGSFWSISILPRRTRYRFVAMTPDRTKEFDESAPFDDDTPEEDIRRIHGNFVERLVLKGWRPQSKDPGEEWYAQRLVKSKP